MYYVYELFASDTEIVFYVGKGKGYRWDDHEKEALSGNTANPHKCYTIRKIWDRGAKVGKRKVYESCDEEACYEVEEQTIAYYGLGNLTNLCAGGEGVRGRGHNTKHHPDLIDPFGFVYPSISNLAAFCEEHGLAYQWMLPVVTEQRNHYKGWRVYSPGASSWHYENMLV